MVVGPVVSFTTPPSPLLGRRTTSSSSSLSLQARYFRFSKVRAKIHVHTQVQLESSSTAAASVTGKVDAPRSWASHLGPTRCFGHRRSSPCMVMVMTHVCFYQPLNYPFPARCAPHLHHRYPEAKLRWWLRPPTDAIIDSSWLAAYGLLRYALSASRGVCNSSNSISTITLFF